MTLLEQEKHCFMNRIHLAANKIKTLTDHHCNFEAALKATGSKAMFVLHWLDSGKPDCSPHCLQSFH